MNYFEGLKVLLEFNVVLMMLGVSAAGIVLGALPGIGPSIAMTLLMPFTFYLLLNIEFSPAEIELTGPAAPAVERPRVS